MTTANLFPRLLGDVGGTNARFGWQAAASDALSHIEVLPCANHVTIDRAIETYLGEAGLPRPRAACIGIANPVTGDQIRMTNHHWTFSVCALQQGLGLDALRVINDFTALALALPDLPDAQKHHVGGPAQGVPDAPIGLLGPGTGLGVSGLLRGPQHWLPIAGEGGHVTLAARTTSEFAVLQLLQQRHGHASAERVLSGQGLADLHTARAALRGECLSVDAAWVTQQALEVHDTDCLQSLDMFAGFLGRVASDLALTLGARGGVYIGGGIVPRLLGWFDQSSFRREFEDKGRFRAYLTEIPVWVITAENSPALLGATRALDMP
jgi:glucokinase